MLYSRYDTLLYNVSDQYNHPFPQPVDQWSEEDVQPFLTANITSYGLKVKSIEILKGEEVGSRGLLQIGLNDLKG